ncbi:MULTISPECIES: hypothetical protein [unclassified Isoptericola]|uniref:hypothetical protein n=1 Tax=unclassified Isoptericola TaxID=2623355 RepID=UPI00364A2A89
MTNEAGGGREVLDREARGSGDGVTPAFAAALAISALAVLYLVPLALVGAAATGLAGWSRPWVVAASVVVFAWALLRWASLGFVA